MSIIVVALAKPGAQGNRLGLELPDSRLRVNDDNL
jgi:hypothetical protein